MEKGQQGVTKKQTRVFDKINGRTLAENCPLRRLPLLRSKILVSGNDDGGEGTVTPRNPRGKTTTDSPSRTHFYIGKLIVPRKTHPAAGEVNIPIEPGSSVIRKNTSRFEDKTGIPVQIQSTMPQMPVQGFHSNPPPAAVKHTVTGKRGESGNIGGGDHDHHHKHSAYIEHVKNQLRTKSDIGEEITISSSVAATKLPARRDSFNDRISNFINQAKKNIKLTHNGE